MSAKQRHKQRVVKRLKEKLEQLSLMEENLHTIVRNHVSKTEKRCVEVLKLEDTNLFLNQYSKIEQSLEAAFNMVELLTYSAEDLIENTDHEGVEEDKLESRKTSPQKNKRNVTRKYSDSEIEKELQEMIQSSSRKRHCSAEAASQTVPEEDSVFPEQNMKKDRVSIETQSMNEIQLQQKSVSDTVCGKEQTVQNTKQNSCHDSRNNFSETFLLEDITDKNKNIAENNSKCSIKSSPKREGRTKKEKVVPNNVRRQLHKEIVIDTDQSSSSQVDSVTFNNDVILASSPKKKSCCQKKRKSPKKKGGKINLNTFKDDTVSETETKNSSKYKVTEEKQMVIPSVKDALNRKPDNKQEVVNNNVKKREESENSSEPAMKSSDLSILEHELTEMMATESSDLSSTSNVKVSAAEKQDETFTQNLNREDSCLRTTHLSQKSHVESLENSGATCNMNLKKTEKSVTPSGEITADETNDASALMEDNSYNGLPNSGKLLTGKVTPVIVSEIVSPWCFFVQKNGPELKKLMEQIGIYMVQVGIAECPLLEPEIGTLCLARYSKDGAFYRAYVMQIHKNLINTNSEVDVLYVDYGNKERVKVTQLRGLPEEFKTLPMQAICCALAEVMPCSKYCVWAEEDIHQFRQYVTGQQLGCNPPTCRSSGEALPLLVELIVSLPMPILPQGGIYLSQFSIAQLMISTKKARHVDVTEQLGLLAKSEEGAEEAAILSQNIAGPKLLAITELSESQCDRTLNVQAVDKVEECKEDKDLHLKKVSDLSSAEKMSTLETCTGITSVQIPLDKKKSGELISPRSENSETESQRDDGRKASGKILDKDKKGAQGANNKAHLDKIKEEAVDLESCETVSTTTSLTTDFDFPSENGIHLSDLHFDLDDLYFNPQGQEVMLAHVKSLGEFYVHIISQQSGETLDRLMKSLNALFENANRRKLTKLSKTFQPEENKLCCAQFLQDNNFYRGIIISTKPEKEIMKGRVLVHYIDFGDEEWLPKRRIFPLPAQFCNVPRLAIKCSLAYLKPTCDEGEPVSTWSESSLEKFVNIAGLEKTLHMHVVHGSMEHFKKSDPCEDSPVLGILLVDNTGTEEVCVNMDMIREGVAQLDTDQSKHEKGKTEERSPDMRIEKWNPMEEDFFSKRNSYNIDIDDAGVATTGYKAKDEERICKFFSSGRNCWRGERCPYRHIIVESGVTYDQEPVYAISDNQQDFLPQMGNWVAMEITTILSPSHFYAILPLGSKSLDTTGSESEKKETGAFGVTGNEETLDDLLDSLNTEYSKRPAHDGNLLLRAIGEIVVARFSEDRTWYRARIIEVTEDKVKVFFVDFGNTEWVPEKEIADIKPQFLHLPFQAVECFMNIEPECNEKWTKEAKLAFRELVDGKTLVGYVKSRSWNGCLWVDLYDTSTQEDVNIKEELVNQGHALKAESQESPTDYSGNLSPASGEVLLVPG